MTDPVTYTLLDPTGNMTLLAETPVETMSQLLTAKKLMELEPDTEQVGFVGFENDGVRLRMAGGEFCGNAAMSAAVLFLQHTGRSEGGVTVRVSGTPEPVAVTARVLPDGSWSATVTMPGPLAVGQEYLPGGERLPLVRFPGITHVILEEETNPETAEYLAREWCCCLGSEALGLMFLDREQSSLRPLVYVPSAETLFWESSCASGTTAVGAYLAAETGQPVRIRLKQPGGTLGIFAEPGGTLQLTGTVRIRKQAVDVPLWKSEETERDQKKA